MIKAIAFDCFGVLLTDALSVLCEELGRRDPAKLDEMRAVIHAANKGIIHPEESTARAAELLGLDVEEYRRQIREGEVRNQPLFDYILELRNSYKTAMLSNITVQGIERRFPDNELNTYFDEVIISGAIGFAKPEPEAYKIMVDRLGCEPAECVFTDDREDFCLAAEREGLRAILFTDLDSFKQQLTEVLERS